MMAAGPDMSTPMSSMSKKGRNPSKQAKVTARTTKKKARPVEGPDMSAPMRPLKQKKKTVVAVAQLRKRARAYNDSQTIGTKGMPISKMKKGALIAKLAERGVEY